MGEWVSGSSHDARTALVMRTTRGKDQPFGGGASADNTSPFHTGGLGCDCRLVWKIGYSNRFFLYFFTHPILLSRIRGKCVCVFYNRCVNIFVIPLHDPLPSLSLPFPSVGW